MKYYAVRVGKKPGIYTTWEKCKAQVHRYPGAVFKSFATKSEAEDFIGNLKTQGTQKNKNTQKSFLNNHTIIEAYTDGSYDVNVIIVNVNENDKGEGYTGVIKMLATLLSSIITPADKKSILNKEYGITITEEIDEEVERMCNLSYDIEERGKKLGIAKEKRATVKSLDGRLPIEEIAEVTRLTVEEVKKILSE